MFEENAGVAQTDGRALTDPDLILAGWQLRIPATGEDLEEDRRPRPKPVKTTTPACPSSSDETRVEAGLPERAASDHGTTEDDSHSVASVTEPRVPSAAATDSEADVSAVGSDVDDFVEPTELAPSSGLVALGIGGIALAGLVGELTRRRRYQQRVRRVGERIPMPDGDSASVEAEARAFSDLPLAELLRDALRALAESARQARRPLPDVRTVRISSDGIELTVAGNEEPLKPFVAQGNGVWAVDAAVAARFDGGSLDPYPALITVGADGDDVILLNLESVGGLAVHGEDSATVDGVLRALAADLVLTPAASTVLLHGVLDDLAATLDPGRLTVAASNAHVERHVDAHARLVEEHLSRVPDDDLRSARVEGGTEVTSGCLVVVSSDPSSAAPQPWSGVVRVQRGLFDASGGARVDLRSDGLANLVGCGLVIQPAVLSAAVVESTADALDVADQPSVPPSSAAPASIPSAGDVPSSTVEGPGVLLLGRIEVVDVAGTCVEPRIARLTEAVAYLALNPGATREEFAEAIWAGRRVEQSTKWNLISRMRTWLGVDAAGQHYLQTVPGRGIERLRLSQGVSSDWDTFRRHVEAANGLDGEVALSHLEKALALVRGRPFAGVDPRRYVWAEPSIQEMVSCITDAAVAAAERHLAAGNYAQARQAAILGLSVDGASERLVDVAVRASQLSGDHASAKRIQHRHDQLMGELDEFEGGMVGASSGEFG